MDPVLAFLAGMLQGATEWLPVSSSGQVVLLLEGMGV
ncbi:MAG: UDP-diphosphatase, partial [Thermoplasmata archaeon]|nr:undecaprenyl-diphosphate phosphatase [Thermoplasmata archaeon]NIS10668.1 undecaprenyl-diphosphate phosphatase [Thermoplasmata archaeon]NIV77422.1 UDP-diphosphatase [Thermoplasmata archaeon]NIW81252.1 UDP-diphosphatase [Thermoplasmata archaeon]NIW87464.1 UDP-diphosphatase [Thermoplasmata archaeon]